MRHLSKLLIASMILAAYAFSTPATAQVTCSQGGTTVAPSNAIGFFVDFDKKTCDSGGYPGQGNGIHYSISTGNTSGNLDVTKVRYTSYMCGIVHDKRKWREADLVPLSGYPKGVPGNILAPVKGGVTYFGAIPGPQSGTKIASLTVTSTVQNTNNLSNPVKYVLTINDLSKPYNSGEFSYGKIQISGGQFDSPSFPSPVCDMGMTWEKYANDPAPGVVDVGCGSGASRCNPYQGDSFCAVERPLLCFADIGLQRPVSLSNKSNAHVWSGGLVVTSTPVKGSTFQTIADADAQCVKEFGSKFRVAEFHDGNGWYMTAYGSSSTLLDKFWVNIKNQRKGNCWIQ